MGRGSATAALRECGWPSSWWPLGLAGLRRDSSQLSRASTQTRQGSHRLHACGVGPGDRLVLDLRRLYVGQVRQKHLTGTPPTDPITLVTLTAVVATFAIINEIGQPLGQRTALATPSSASCVTTACSVVHYVMGDERASRTAALRRRSGICEDRRRARSGGDEGL